MTTASSMTQDENLEIFSLIWLDELVNQSSENVECQRKLRTSINYIKTFVDSNQCQQYIQSLSQHDRIILIVSGRLGQQILPNIHDLRQLIAVYVYCMEKQANEQWTKKFIKVKSVVTRTDDLIQQIKNDQTKHERDKLELPLTINFYNPNILDAQSLTGSNSNFIHSQLIIDYLLDMQSNEINKSNLLSLCKETYKNNDIELKIIQEFEHTYLSTRSISWYTRNSFLKRLLNKAFQIENLSLILNSLFLIHDIRQQLDLNKSLSITRVYRSKLITKKELETFSKSIGQFISINTFLSATPDRQQAFSILQEYETTDDTIKILFEIDTNPELNDTKSFADITSYDDIKEILFTIGTIFQIKNLNHEKNGIIIICITKYNKSLLDDLKIEYIKENKSLLKFGHMLWKIGRFDDAENCYNYLIKNLPDQHDDISKCYHGLGNIASDRNEYETSLRLHYKSLEIKKNTLVQFHPSLAYSYNSIGAIYQEKGDYERALGFYQQALDIWGKEYGENHLYVAMCYDNMGLTYEECKKYAEALDCYQKVLIIRENLLSNDHLELGDVCRSIGIIYKSLFEFDLALEYFNKSIRIFKKSCQTNVAMVLNYMGNIYEDKAELEEALAYYQEAMEIFRQLLPSTQDDFVETEKNRQRVINKMNK